MTVCQRALDWIFAMQCKNGGWASFDRDNTQDDLPAHPVCRPQRDAGSADGGHYGTHPGDAGELRLHAARRRVENARSSLSRGTGSRRKLVRPLGRELSVRDVSGAARAWRRWACGTTSRRLCRRRSGFAWCRTRMAAGARPATATTIPRRADWAKHAFADGVGGSRTAGGRRYAERIRWRRGSDGWWRGSRRTVRGTRASARDATRQAIYTGTGFPRVFYLAYHAVSRLFPAAGVDELQAGHGS